MNTKARLRRLERRRGDAAPPVLFLVLATKDPQQGEVAGLQVRPEAERQLYPLGIGEVARARRGLTPAAAAIWSRTWGMTPGPGKFALTGP